MTTATQDSDHGTLDQDTVDRDALSEQELLVRGWDALPLPIASPRWRPPSTRRAPGAAAWPSPTTRTSTSPPGSFPGAALPFPLHLRLLPRLGRPRRRGWLHGLGPRPAQPLGPRTRRLLPGPRAPSGLCGPAETIRACSIPKQPFADLLVAFRQDQTVTRFETMRDVLAYCHYSANPVGRLVLYACGEQSEEHFRLSDLTCSALQLANFWQDVRVDFGKNRIYIPLEDMRRFGVGEETIASGIATPNSAPCCATKWTMPRALF